MGGYYRPEYPDFKSGARWDFFESEDEYEYLYSYSGLGLFSIFLFLFLSVPG
jgi:hypothetical protein